MFQFTGFPSIRYGLAYGYMRSSHVGFPIQKSPDHRIFAPPRSLSQLITSFIGSQCQGIRPALFFAWPFRYYSVNIWRLVGLLFLYFSLLSQRLVSSLSLRLTYFRCFIYAVFKVHTWCFLYGSVSENRLASVKLACKDDCVFCDTLACNAATKKALLSSSLTYCFTSFFLTDVLSAI